MTGGKRSVKPGVVIESSTMRREKNRAPTTDRPITSSSVATSGSQAASPQIQAGAEEAPQKPGAISEVIKAELAVIALLVFFIGILSTDAYYSAFSLKYQFLDLPPFHVIYRGLTVVPDVPYVILPYLVAAAWLGMDRHWIERYGERFLRFRTIASYGVIFILLAATYPLARHAGVKQATMDMYESTSTLPRIVWMKMEDGSSIGIERRYRLLAVDSTFVVFFKPLDGGTAESLAHTLPNIKRIPKGAVHAMDTNR